MEDVVVLSSHKKKCQHCDNKLTISSTRDLHRKKFCSHKCRQLDRWGRGTMTYLPVKPKGITHTWSKTYTCQLCDAESADGHPRQKWCAECVPDQKWRHRARRYGVGKKQWDALLEKQRGACALCPAEPEVVDHDHESGRVRGLLCGSCNLRLSGLDDKDWLSRALHYTED